MIINTDVLKRFNACSDASEEFARRFPYGLDISRLWREESERQQCWRELLADEFLQRYVGWAILTGILPARIEADLRGADLSRADLSGADLRRANLRGADLRGARYCQHTIWLSEFDLERSGSILIED